LPAEVVLRRRPTERVIGRSPVTAERCAVAPRRPKPNDLLSVKYERCTVGSHLDNVFVERLWRSVKYEDVYVRGYEAVPELQRGLAQYFPYYNEGRPHQGLDYRTPAAVYQGG
jgi:Integrase core domain